MSALAIRGIFVIVLAVAVDCGVGVRGVGKVCPKFIEEFSINMKQRVLLGLSVFPFFIHIFVDAWK